MAVYKYRGCNIWFDPLPIPIRTMDWHWAHDGYDGPGDPRHGDGRSYEACVEHIDEVMDDLEEDPEP